MAYWIEAIATFTFILFIMFLRKQRSSSSSCIIEWPVVGMLPSLLINTNRIHDYFYEFLKLNKHTIHIKGPWFSNMSLIGTSDPENIHYILSSKFVNFTKGPVFKDIFQVLGDGILAADSDSWKMQRKLILTLFKHNMFLKLMDTITQQKIEMGLFKILDNASDKKHEVDMQDMFQRLTLDVTCTFLLGSDLNSLTLDLHEVPFAKALDDIEEVLLHRHLKPKSLWKLQKWLQIGVEKKGANAIKTIDSFIYQQISSKQKNSHKNPAGSETFDLISNFMSDEVQAQCRSMNKSIETFLRDSVMSILAAGRDTTATALTWFIWLISTHPKIEAKILEEIQNKFQMKTGEPWKFPIYQTLNELVYLHATLCETLRLYPPLPFNHKAAVKPDMLPNGQRVQKDTEVIISMYSMGRMEEIWGQDCHEFRPERWISNKGTIIEMPSFKFNVFGAGPRACVGKELAFREMKIVAAAIVWSYDFGLKVDHVVVPANSVILHMRHGLKVNVRRKV